MKMLALTFFLFLLVNGCSVKAVYHDEDKAIDTANQFLRYLVRENYTAAYNNYISDSIKKNLSFDHFESALKKSVEIRGQLIKAVFDSFQPVPGQRTIQLYYNVFHKGAGIILYHFVLEGDDKVGYEIILVDIGNQIQYPPNMKYLGVKKMKKDRYIEVTGD